MSLLSFTLSTHILNTSTGRPVDNLLVKLYRKNGDHWLLVKEGITNTDGRFANFVDNTFTYSAGTYKLHFMTKQYYDSINAKTLYPVIDIIFDVDEPKHYHIPLLLSAFGYTTYRGS